MNIDEVNDFFNKKALKIKFQFSTEPLYSAVKEENLERYKAIPLVNRSKILNLKIISKSDTFIIFYHMYRKYFTKYTSYKEISTKDDLYGTILSLLKDNEADPEAIKEKIIFE